MPSVPKWLGNTMETLMGSKMPLLEVIQTDDLSPSVKRIRFQGPLSGMNFQLGYAVIIRVNKTEFRNYTASFADTEKGILEIIVHLHGSAPGSQFMSELKTGDKIRVSMPRGMKMYDPSVKQQLVFGDESSLGLAASFLSPFIKNGHQYQFYLELDEANKKVPELLGLNNCTVFTKNNTFRNEQLANDLPVFEIPGWQAGNFILTGNAKSLQTFRRVLKQKSCAGKIAVKAYWAEGKKGL